MVVLGNCCHRDAAPVLTGFETGFEQIRSDGVNERAEQGVIQSTDQAGVADGECVERAIRMTTLRSLR